MNGKEQRRAMILTGVIEGRLTAPEAAELMGVSGRGERRLRHAFLPANGGVWNTPPNLRCQFIRSARGSIPHHERKRCRPRNRHTMPFV
jgi:hypothetical protein